MHTPWLRFAGGEGAQQRSRRRVFGTRPTGRASKGPGFQRCTLTTVSSRGSSAERFATAARKTRADAREQHAISASEKTQPELSNRGWWRATRPPPVWPRVRATRAADPTRHGVPDCCARQRHSASRPAEQAQASAEVTGLAASPKFQATLGSERLGRSTVEGGGGKHVHSLATEERGQAVPGRGTNSGNRPAGDIMMQKESSDTVHPPDSENGTHAGQDASATRQWPHPETCQGPFPAAHTPEKKATVLDQANKEPLRPPGRPPGPITGGGGRPPHSDQGPTTSHGLAALGELAGEECPTRAGRLGPRRPGAAAGHRPHSAAAQLRAKAGAAR